MPNIFLIGPMGAGKTTIGRLLALELDYLFIDSDREIEAKAGADISWIFDVEGEEGFRKRESAMLAELTLEQNIVLATGGGAVLNSGNRQLLSSRGTTVYIYAPIDVLVARTSQDKTRPLLSVKDPKAAMRKIIEARDPLYREIANHSISTESNSSKQIVSQIVSLVSE